MSTIPCCLTISTKLDCTEDVERCLFTMMLLVCCRHLLQGEILQYLLKTVTRQPEPQLPSQNRSSDTEQPMRWTAVGLQVPTQPQPLNTHCRKHQFHGNLILSFVHRTAHLK